MNDEERFLALCAETRQMTGSHSPELAAKVSELAELNIEGAGAGVDVRLQDSIMPNLIMQELEEIWMPLWASLPDWEKSEVFQEISGSHSAVDLFWGTDWDDDEMMNNSAAAIGLKLDDEDEEASDEDEEEDQE